MKEKKKIHGMNEIAYIVGMIFCAFAVVLGTKASLGISVVAAPGYLYSIIFKDIFPWITQGKAEYIWQGIQLIIMCLIIMRVKVKYIFSLLSSVLGGVLIDTWFWILGGNGTYEHIGMRIAALVISQICLGFAVSLFFRTTVPVQVCELLMVEISKKFNVSASRIKLIYDLVILALSLVLSLVFTKTLTGIGIGTIMIAVCTSPLTVLFGKILDKFFVFDSIIKSKRA